MIITTVCPQCKTAYLVDAKLHGKRMRCPNPTCRSIFEIQEDRAGRPSPAPAAAAPAPWPEAAADVFDEPLAAEVAAIAEPPGGAVAECIAEPPPGLWEDGLSETLAARPPDPGAAAPPPPVAPPIKPAPVAAPAPSASVPVSPHAVADQPPAPAAAPTAEVFVGPRPFETGERLYGREREVAELTDLLNGERIVLLHSPSGAGKTSLLQAALVPAMREERFFIPHDHPDDAPPGPAGPRPIILRLNRPPEATDPPGANRYLLSVLLALEGHRPRALRRPAAALAAMTLDAYLAEAFEGGAAAPPGPGGEDAGHPLLLFFDQFEEILTQDPTDEDAKLAFFRALSKALTKPGRWALFAMREDYQPALEPFLKRIPPLFRATYRLDFLRQDKAVEAIRKPAWEAGEVDFVVAPDLVKDLMQIQVQQPDGSFKRKKGPSVEPVLLQVVCRRVWAMPRTNPKRIGTDVWQPPDQTPVPPSGDPPTPSSLPPQAEHLRRGVDTVLAEYYAETVRQAAEAGKVSERLVRDWFRLKLIPGGIRQPVTLGDDEKFGLTPECIKILDRAFLIRKEIQGGVYRYELAHDRLIRPVMKSNETWRKENLTRFQLAAELWAQNGRSADLLVRGEILDEGERWAKHKKHLLSQEELDFLRACQDARRDRRRRRNGLLAAVALTLALGGSILYHWTWALYDAKDRANKEADFANRYKERQERDNFRLFCLLSLVKNDYRRVYGQSDSYRQDEVESADFHGIDRAFEPPATATIVARTLELAEHPSKNGRYIALGAVKGLEQRANEASKEADLSACVEALRQIADGIKLPANDEKAAKGLQAVVREARRAAARAERRRPLLRDAKITYQFTPLMQFGLRGVSSDKSLVRLTYSPQGSTNRTTLVIDGKGVIFGSDLGTWYPDKKAQGEQQSGQELPLGKRPDDKDRLGVRSVWYYPRSDSRPAQLEVTQILEIVRSKRANLLDTCVVGYVIENKDPRRTFQVGLKVDIDTYIATKDANPFYVEGEPEPITQPRLFEGPKVPGFVQAMEYPSLEHPGYVAFFSLLSAPGLPRADRFLIDNLPRPSAYAQRPDLAPEASGSAELRDSAVSIYWAPKDLPPGDRRVLAYAYGLGKVSARDFSPRNEPLILSLATERR